MPLFCYNLADMDGFKLLEAIGLELDLPVISERSSCSACRTAQLVRLICELSSCSTLQRLQDDEALAAGPYGSCSFCRTVQLMWTLPAAVMASAAALSGHAALAAGIQGSCSPCRTAQGLQLMHQLSSCRTAELVHLITSSAIAALTGQMQQESWLFCSCSCTLTC